MDIMIKSGISQIGGKFRSRKQLSRLTPRHDFFLSMFSGACHYELNKPRCQYECFNDLDSEFINYLITIKRFPKEFNEMKKGIFGLVSQEIVNRIVNGELKPNNSIEKAYFFYYLNKTCFGGKEAKGKRSVSPVGFQSQISKAKRFRGITLPTSTKEKNIEHYNEEKKKSSHFHGIAHKKFIGDYDSRKEGKKKKSSRYKGMNPKYTRPYSNNDLGLLTPLDPNAIVRLRYVNLTSYDFRHVYKLYYKAFHERKKLSVECFIYADPPYPSTEKYYGNLFKPEDHQDLIDIMIQTPFNFMLSIGGDCQFYLDILKENDWIIKEVKTKHSTDSKTQNEIIEYACMNYDINTFPKMVMDLQSDIRIYGKK